MKNLKDLKNDINLVICEELPDFYDYKNKIKLDRDFRNGFWMLTSYRFFILYSLMKNYELTDIIHLKNDVLIYENVEILKDKVSKDKMYLPFDTFQRNIASIMYIPNHQIFENVLNYYNFSLNDMENFQN